MGRVMFAAGPDFVEQEGAGLVGAAMQIVLQAAFLFARGAYEGAQLGFEEELLALFGAQRDDQSESAFGKFDDSNWRKFAGGTVAGGFFRFSLGHVRGDCTPKALQRNGNCRFRVNLGDDL